MYLIEFLSQCVAFIPSDIRRRRPTAGCNSRSNAKDSVPVVRRAREKPVAEEGNYRLKPFGYLLARAYICKVHFHSIFHILAAATFVSRREDERENWRHRFPLPGSFFSFLFSRLRSDRERRRSAFPFSQTTDKYLNVGIIFSGKTQDVGGKRIFDAVESFHRTPSRAPRRMMLLFISWMCSAYFLHGGPRQAYLLAPGVLDYSLNVRQIDRRLRNIIYLTKRVLLYYFYIFLYCLQSSPNR